MVHGPVFHYIPMGTLLWSSLEVGFRYSMSNWILSCFWGHTSGYDSATVAAADGHLVHKVYTLKRIQCMDSELRRPVFERSRCIMHFPKPNKNNMQCTMLLLGMTFNENNTACYMRFLFYPYSLKQEINNQCIFDPLQELHDTQHCNPNKNNNSKIFSIFNPGMKPLYYNCFNTSVKPSLRCTFPDTLTGTLKSKMSCCKDPTRTI
jgi:hypothetical protein